MKRSTLHALIVALAVVVGAIALLVPRGTERPAETQGLSAVPGLEERVNEVTRLTVTGAGEQVLATLRRGEAGWTVDELSGYPARIETLREVLGGLARAEVMEPKTDNPAYYDRLGVEPVAGEDAGGLRLDLAASDDDQWSVIVGNEAPARGGHYLRMADATGSVLARFDANIPGNAAGWADTRVVDLMSAEVAEVRVMHADGEVITASKTSADETDFTLAELPEGREIKSAWSVNSLGSALSTLDFEAVRPADGFDWTGASELRTVRFDGLVVIAHLLRTEEDGDWVRLEVETPWLEASTSVESGDDAGDAASGEPDVNAAAAAELEQTASALAERTRGWAYRIPGYKADAMVPRLADLLREPAGS
ncbi:MAG: DUF4340 domain-containing protein [Xanthomonadales bacterium]|jgi:hypothetical protein|nr:DUF4340 domain-containing protein [Xanthomonadales bacterium]